MGYPVTIGKDGNKNKWEEEYDLPISDIDAERARIEKQQKELVRSLEPAIIDFADKYIRVDWVPVEMPKVPVNVGLTDLIKQREGKVAAVAKEVAAVEWADRTIEEVHEKIRAFHKTMAARGKPDFTQLFAGGRLNHEGHFEIRNRAATVIVPTDSQPFSVKDADGKAGGLTVKRIELPIEVLLWIARP